MRLFPFNKFNGTIDYFWFIYICSFFPMIDELFHIRTINKLNAQEICNRIKLNRILFFYLVMTIYHFYRCSPLKVDVRKGDICSSHALFRYKGNKIHGNIRCPLNLYDDKSWHQFFRHTTAINWNFNWIFPWKMNLNNITLIHAEYVLHRIYILM